MSEHRDDAILTETLDRIRRAELATVLYPPGTPEHTRAVERLTRATQQLRRLVAAVARQECPGAGPTGSLGPEPSAG